MQEFYVKALWDPDAGVFHSETDIPGLTVEAATVEDFRSLVADLAPEMLADNTDLHGHEVIVHFSSEQNLALAVA